VAELIFHHYQMSPFSEKMRRIFAFKKLPWHSVRAPAVMPKPDQIELTGGYRKAPVLQIGNHVYCDTSLMARVVDRLAPSPPLYDAPMAAAAAEWADSTLFELAVAVGFRPTRFDDVLQWLTPEELSKMADDRKVMRADSRKQAMPRAVARAHLDAQLVRLEQELAERPFLLGAAPSIADFSAYHPVWFLKTLAPEPLAPFPRVLAWAARIADIGGPDGPSMSSEAALAVAKGSPSAWTPDAPFANPYPIAAGSNVVVRAADYGRDAVNGVLVQATPEEIVLRRETARAGVVYVHFPVLGYDLEAA